nr:VanZ family protein [Tenggerimyces flavus]
MYWPGSPGPGLFPYSDKLVHLGVFGLVAFLGRWVGIRSLWLGVVLVAHAILSEVIQATLLPARSGDPLDALADIVGVGLGLVVAAAISGRSLGEEGPNTGN